MVDHLTHPPRLASLAEKLVSDIRRRGLAPGDRYLTTDQVSRMLGVRKALANKALQHLADRQILVRRQRMGTFVGPGLARKRRSAVQTVFVLLPGGDPIAASWSFDPFVEGLRSAIDGVNVQFSFVPQHDATAYVRELIDGARGLGQFAGVVPVSCPPEVYRFLAEHRVPAVVYGTPYSSQLSIASVDVDNRQCGRMLSGYLVDRGHRRIALLLTGAGRPGDNDFFDGISEFLTAAELPHNSLVPRFLRSDEAAVRAVVREMLSEPDRPTAVITRGRVYADLVESAAAEAGLDVPGDLEIVFDDENQTSSPVNPARYTHAEPNLSFRDMAALIGRTLKQLCDGEAQAPLRFVVPVELRQGQPIETTPEKSP